MPISNWLGVVLFAIGVWLFTSGLRRRRRALAARRVAQQAGQAIDVGTSRRLAGVTAILRPVVYVMVLVTAAVAIMTTKAPGVAAMFSAIDLFGFLVMLAGYAFWFGVSTRYRDVERAAPVPALAAGEPG